MFDENGQRLINAHVAAIRRITDPHRALMADQSSPVMITGGKWADLRQFLAYAQAVNEEDADLIHMDFEPGSEAKGPVNIRISMGRGGILYTHSECWLWADPRGKMFILSKGGRKPGLASFDPDGMDYTPGRPKSDIAKGIKRAAAKLKELVAEELARKAANDVCDTQGERAA